MTKKEWNNLRIGSKVTMSLFDFYTGKDNTYIGTVVRANSNWSQVLVKWEEGSENWYGRLGLEVFVEASI